MGFLDTVSKTVNNTRKRAQDTVNQTVSGAQNWAQNRQQQHRESEREAQQARQQAVEDIQSSAQTTVDETLSGAQNWAQNRQQQHRESEREAQQARQQAVEDIQSSAQDTVNQTVSDAQDWAQNRQQQHRESQREAQQARYQAVEDIQSSAQTTVDETVSGGQTAVRNEVADIRASMDQEDLAERQRQYENAGALGKAGAAAGVGFDVLLDNPRLSVQEAGIGAASQISGASSEAEFGEQVQSTYEQIGTTINKPLEGTGLAYGENSVVTGATDIFARPIIEGPTTTLTGIDPATGETNQIASGGDVLETAFLPISAAGSAARAGSAAARGARKASQSTDMANPLTALRGLSRVARGGERAQDATRAASQADDLPSSFDEQMQTLSNAGRRSAPTRTQEVSTSNSVTDLPALRQADTDAPPTASQLSASLDDLSRSTQQGGQSVINRLQNTADEVIDIGPARTTSRTADRTEDLRDSTRTRFGDRASDAADTAASSSTLGASAQRTLDNLATTLGIGGRAGRTATSGARATRGATRAESAEDAAAASRTARTANRAESAADATDATRAASRAESAEDAADTSRTLNRAESAEDTADAADAATSGGRIQRTISNLGDNVGTWTRRLTYGGLAAIGGAAGYEALTQPDSAQFPDGSYIQHLRTHTASGEPAAEEYQVYSPEGTLLGHTAIIGIDTQTGIVYHLAGDPANPSRTISRLDPSQFEAAATRGRSRRQDQPSSPAAGAGTGGGA